MRQQRVGDKETMASKRAIERWENEGGEILTQMEASSNSLPRREPYSDQVVTGGGLIEVHFRELNQLFDSLDHSPFREKDLDPNAEEHIVTSIKELPSRAPCALCLYRRPRYHQFVTFRRVTLAIVREGAYPASAASLFLSEREQ